MHGLGFGGLEANPADRARGTGQTGNAYLDNPLAMTASRHEP